jgi:hypothetical protein
MKSCSLSPAVAGAALVISHVAMTVSLPLRVTAQPDRFPVRPATRFLLGTRTRCAFAIDHSNECF